VRQLVPNLADPSVGAVSGEVHLQAAFGFLRGTQKSAWRGAA